MVISTLSIAQTRLAVDSVKGPTMKTSNLNSHKLAIRVGSKRLTATLFENKSSEVLKTLLPLSIQMKDLNGNEKFFDLTQSLPTNPFNPKEIKAGDLMLYGSNTLVLFYKSFSTSYSYTKLGHIDEPSALQSLLGKDEVSVVLELLD
jgi:hypothetical protein